MARAENDREKGALPAAFPFESRYVDVGGRRIHYVEEGRGAPVLFVHGNPTWSYLWRNVLPTVAAETGRRGIALDLLGFGRSEKLQDGDYSLELHASILDGFIEKLGLKDIVLVLHDWGGPLGMWYATHHPQNVSGIVLMETFLWDFTWKDFGRFKRVFRLLRSPLGHVLLQTLNLFVERILPGSVINREHLGEEAMNRYREPFPSAASRRAIRAFPQLIPIEGRPETSRLFIDEIDRNLPRLDFPILWIMASPGAIVTDDTRYRLVALAMRMRRLAVQDFGPGLHYLPEEDPGKLAAMIGEWMRGNNLTSQVENIQRDAA